MSRDFVGGVAIRDGKAYPIGDTEEAKILANAAQRMIDGEEPDFAAALRAECEKHGVTKFHGIPLSEIETAEIEDASFSVERKVCTPAWIIGALAIEFLLENFKEELEEFIENDNATVADAMEASIITSWLIKTGTAWFKLRPESVNSDNMPTLSDLHQLIDTHGYPCEGKESGENASKVSFSGGDVTLEEVASLKRALRNLTNRKPNA